MPLTFILLPFAAAFIGWCINSFFIKFLFYPLQPKKLLGFNFQGLFSKRKNEMSGAIASIISKKLVSFDEVEKKIADTGNVEKIMPVLEMHIDTFLKEKLTARIPMLGMFAGEKTIGQVKQVFMEELEELFPVLIKQYVSILQSDINVEKIIYSKLNSLSIERTETLVNNALAKEFRLFKLSGAVAGFLIGIMQIFVTLIMK